MNYELLKKKLVKDLKILFITVASVLLIIWLLSLGGGFGGAVFAPLVYIPVMVAFVYYAKALVGSMNIFFDKTTPKEIKLSYLFLTILFVSPIVVFVFMAIQYWGGLGSFISKLHTPSP